MKQNYSRNKFPPIETLQRYDSASNIQKFTSKSLITVVNESSLINCMRRMAAKITTMKKACPWKIQNLH